MLQEVLWLRLHKRLASWGRGTDEAPAIWHWIREGLLVHCGVWLPVPTDEQEERSLVYWEIGRQSGSGMPWVYVALSIGDLTGLEVWSRICQGNCYRRVDSATATAGNGSLVDTNPGQVTFCSTFSKPMPMDAYIALSAGLDNVSVHMWLVMRKKVVQYSYGTWMGLIPLFFYWRTWNLVIHRKII